MWLYTLVRPGLAFHPSAPLYRPDSAPPMASFATFPLMDASRDSRIHEWIAEQYSFALSEFQDDHPWRDDPPSLRESKLLPDDFDLIAPPPPPPQRDTDSNRDSESTHSCDPPLLPSPLPLLHDAHSHLPAPQGSTNLEDALNGLIREMNSWRFAPASRSALTLTLSDRNKVCLAPFNRVSALSSRTPPLRPFPFHRPYLRLPPWKTFPPHRRLPHHRPHLPLFPLPLDLLSGPSTGVRRLLTAAAPPLTLTLNPRSLLLHRMCPYALVEVAILQSPPRFLGLSRPLRLLYDMRYTFQLRRNHRHHLLPPQPL
jgi:hypothetical protein